MSESPLVRRVDAEELYEIVVDGRRAGLTAYRDRGEQRVFFHTEVGEEYGGQGLAARLVLGALGDVRASGKRIVPICPYVARYLERHDGFGDLVDPVTPEVRGWLKERLGGRAE